MSVDICETDATQELDLDLDLDSFFGEPDDPQAEQDEDELSASERAADIDLELVGTIFDPTPVKATGGINPLADQMQPVATSGLDHRPEDQRLKMSIDDEAETVTIRVSRKREIENDEMEAAQLAVSDAALLIEESKLQVKAAKAAFKEAVERLQELRTERANRLDGQIIQPSFSDARADVSGMIGKLRSIEPPQPFIPSHVSPQAVPDVRVENDPATSTDLDQLGLTPGLLEKLRQISGVRTIADLERFMRDHGQYWYRRDQSGVEGIGKAANGKVLDALDRWRKKNPIPEPEHKCEHDNEWDDCQLCSNSSPTNPPQSMNLNHERLHEGEPEPDVDAATEAINRAISFGREARQSEAAGKGRPACPYPRDSLLAEKWFEGYSPKPEVSEI